MKNRHGLYAASSSYVNENIYLVNASVSCPLDKRHGASVPCTLPPRPWPPSGSPMMIRWTMTHPPAAIPALHTPSCSRPLCIRQKTDVRTVGAVITRISTCRAGFELITIFLTCSPSTRLRGGVAIRNANVSISEHPRRARSSK